MARGSLNVRRTLLPKRLAGTTPVPITATAQAITSTGATVTAPTLTPVALTVAAAGVSAAVAASQASSRLTGSAAATGQVTSTVTASTRLTPAAQAIGQATLVVTSVAAAVLIPVAQVVALAQAAATAPARLTPVAAAIATAQTTVTAASTLTPVASVNAQAAATVSATVQFTAAAQAASQASAVVTAIGIQQLTVTAQAVAQAASALSAPALLVPSGQAASQATVTLIILVNALNNAEGGTGAATVTTANSGGTSGRPWDQVDIASGASVIFDTTHAHTGQGASGGTLMVDDPEAGTLGSATAKSYRFSTGATSGLARVQWNTLGSQSQVWFRFYLYITALPAATIRLCNGDQGSTSCAVVVLLTTGKLQIRTGSAGAQTLTSTNTVPLSQWIRVEGFFIGDPANGQVELSVFLTPDSTVPTEVTTSGPNTDTFGAMNHFNFGVSTNTANVAPYWEDDVGFSNLGYLGPATPPALLAPEADAVSVATAVVQTSAPIPDATAAATSQATAAITATSQLTLAASAVAQAASPTTAAAQLATTAQATAQATMTVLATAVPLLTATAQATAATVTAVQAPALITASAQATGVATGALTVSARLTATAVAVGLTTGVVTSPTVTFLTPAAQAVTQTAALVTVAALLGGGGGAPAVPTFVQGELSGSTGSSTAPIPNTCAFSSNVTAGDLMVVCICGNDSIQTHPTGDHTVWTITDTLGSICDCAPPARASSRRLLHPDVGRRRALQRPEHVGWSNSGAGVTRPHVRAHGRPRVLRCRHARQLARSSTAPRRLIRQSGRSPPRMPSSTSSRGWSTTRAWTASLAVRDTG